jgi:hypothetical protein
MNSLIKVPSYSKLNFQEEIFFTQNWCNITLRISQRVLMKRNFKQWWSTILPMSIKWTITSHLKSFKQWCKTILPMSIKWTITSHLKSFKQWCKTILLMSIKWTITPHLKSFKQWCKTIPPMSIKRTINSHLKSLNIKKQKNIAYNIGNPRPVLEQAQKCGWV